MCLTAFHGQFQFFPDQSSSFSWQKATWYPGLAPAYTGLPAQGKASAMGHFLSAPVSKRSVTEEVEKIYSHFTKTSSLITSPLQHLLHHAQHLTMWLIISHYFPQHSAYPVWGPEVTPLEIPRPGQRWAKTEVNASLAGLWCTVRVTQAEGLTSKSLGGRMKTCYGSNWPLDFAFERSSITQHYGKATALWLTSQHSSGWDTTACVHGWGAPPVELLKDMKNSG